MPIWFPVEAENGRETRKDSNFRFNTKSREQFILSFCVSKPLHGWFCAQVGATRPCLLPTRRQSRQRRNKSNVKNHVASYAVSGIWLFENFYVQFAFFLTGSAFCAFFRINLYSQNGHLVKNSVNGSKRTDVSAKRSVNNDRKYNGKDKNQKFPFK